MAEKENIVEEPLSNTDLAYERTFIAEDRTLLAWIRTAVSLISFGFTIYKFFHEREPEPGHVLTAREVGMIMIGMGLLGLLLAQIDHYSATRILRKQYPRRRKSITSAMSILIWIFGLSLFFAALLRE